MRQVAGAHVHAAGPPSIALRRVRAFSLPQDTEHSIGLMEPCPICVVRLCVHRLYYHVVIHPMPQNTAVCPLPVCRHLGDAQDEQTEQQDGLCLLWGAWQFPHAQGCRCLNCSNYITCAKPLNVHRKTLILSTAPLQYCLLIKKSYFNTD